ncbi:MAG: YlbF family regulator [Clostridia bacterium]|nr:YlbF family regulator [Clostridia bacterium]
MEYSTAHQLAREIRESREWKEYHALKESVMGDETQAALIREFRKLQIAIQMSAMQGKSPDSEDMQRFSGINTLLFSKPEVRDFLLAEMQLQRSLGDIFKILTDAADLDMDLGLGNLSV